MTADAPPPAGPPSAPPPPAPPSGPPSPARPPRRWVAPLLVAALVGGLYFVRLGQDLPLRSHEALLAESARNMYSDRPATVVADSPDGPTATHPSPWLVPNFNDVPRLRKTPLPYWTVAGLAYLAGGVDEWTARLPSAAAAAGTVFIIVALMRRHLSRRAAYLGGAALAASVGFVMIGRQAIADMPMTFFTTASLAALWMAVEECGRRRFLWLLATGGAGGLAMLAKGPAPLVVFVFPYCVAAGMMIKDLMRQRAPSAPSERVPLAACSQCGGPQALADKPPVAPGGEGDRTEWRWTLAGAVASAALFITITAPWPVAVYLQVPDAWGIWKAESFDRSVGDFGHEHPIYFYLPRLPVLLLPWTVFFIVGIVVAIRRAARETADRWRLTMAAAWLVGPLVGFSLAVGKQDHYILPILPAAAIVTAIAFEHFLAPPSERVRRAGRLLMLVHGAVAVVCAIIGIAIYIVFKSDPSLVARMKVPAEFVRPEVFAPVLAIGAIWMAGGVLMCLFARRRPAASLAALAVTFAAAYLWSWPTLQGPMDRSATTAAFGRQVRETVGDAPVYAFNGTNATAIFYADRSMPEIPAPPPGLASYGVINPNASERAWLVKVLSLMDSERPWFVMCTEKNLDETRKCLNPLDPILHVTDPWRAGEGFWLLEFPGAAPPDR